jgi:hypothetical protein
VAYCAFFGWGFQRDDEAVDATNFVTIHLYFVYWKTKKNLNTGIDATTELSEAECLQIINASSSSSSSCHL